MEYKNLPDNEFNEYYKKSCEFAKNIKEKNLKVKL